jgi:hypothetical protein
MVIQFLFCLSILNLQNTRMGDSDVGCFNWSRNLTHLFLQCPSSDNGDLCCHQTCLTDYVSDHANNVMEHRVCDGRKSYESDCLVESDYPQGHFGRYRCSFSLYL